MSQSRSWTDMLAEVQVAAQKAGIKRDWWWLEIAESYGLVRPDDAHSYRVDFLTRTITSDGDDTVLATVTEDQLERLLTIPTDAAMQTAMAIIIDRSCEAAR